MPRPRRRAGKTAGPHVAVIGAGISGMVAALRLLERGYRVTLYEEKTRVGGNLAGFEADGVRYDIYPHMFGDWYKNFWNLVENDLKLERGDSDSASFQPRYMFKVLDPGAFPKYIDLLNVESPASAAWTNLFSGFASPAEMFLWAYSSLDGLSYSLVDDDVLDRVSVEGFLRTRPYTTNAVAQLHDSVLMNIWSVHGSETSAAAYRRFLEHNAPLPSPLVWLLTGNLGTKLMDPLRRRIEALGGTFQTGTRVVEVVLTDSDGPGKPARATSLTVQATKYDQETEKVRAVGKTTTLPLGPEDSVILAVSPTALGYLVTSGDPDHRIVDKLPALSQVRRLAAEPIPVLNLYFKRKLPHIPKENVQLRGSRYDLTFLDLEQIWHDESKMSLNGKRRTVLCVAASDYYALPSAKSHQQAECIVHELRKYLPHFELTDVDWKSTYYDTNADNMLFLNTVGGKQWQPETHYPDKIANLFFGGDCTVNAVRMATVESATVSGLQAARGVWAAHPLGNPIEIEIADPPPLALIVALKSLMAPWACAAKLWATAGSTLPALASGGADAEAAMAAALFDLYATPFFMAADVWQTIVRTAASYGAHMIAAGAQPVSRKKPA